jgi:hypothetical protein
MRKLRAPLLLLPLLGIIPAACLAQCVYETISVSRVQGSIFDSLGQPIPDVEISLKSEGKVVANTTTDEAGRFSVSANPGKYDLYANARNFEPGFARVDVGSDLVGVLRATRLWMILSVGVSEADECSSLTTTSRREFNKAVQRYKQKH